MSANLVVDLRNTVDVRTSVAVGSGSDLAVGQIVDFLGANTATQIFIAAGFGASGPIEVRVQTSDSLTSGSFTDPTSGLAALPSVLLSGGIFLTNSGLYASGWSSPSAPINNAPLFCSGGQDFAFFQRPHRYARLIYASGAFPNAITAGFIGQKRTTSSGAGFSWLPQTEGSINV